MTAQILCPVYFRSVYSSFVIEDLFLWERAFRLDISE